jgi:hypothetical protein
MKPFASCIRCIFREAQANASERSDDYTYAQETEHTVAAPESLTGTDKEGHDYKPTE